jgi:hypothetical protein
VKTTDAGADEADQVITPDASHASDGDGAVAEALVFRSADDAYVSAEGVWVVEARHGVTLFRSPIVHQMLESIGAQYPWPIHVPPMKEAGRQLKIGQVSVFFPVNCPERSVLTAKTCFD